MFHYRSTPSLASIEGRLRSIERDIERLGRKAGRRASSGAVAASEQIGDALSPILSEIADRIRDGGRFAGDEAARFGNDAVRLGTRIGNQALRRVSEEVEQRPLVTLAVALGIGVLIGMSGRRS
jgi:ElaB/YqjD/DUF883 family membrane-anchored ribosome-binding protein